MEKANALLLSEYAISILDAGLSYAEWQTLFGDRSADEVVKLYAEKYGLTEINSTP